LSLVRKGYEVQLIAELVGDWTTPEGSRVVQVVVATMSLKKGVNRGEQRDDLP
jgi:hypothetical protein